MPRRLFSDTSFWNQPIAPDARTDPKSEHFLSLLAEEPDGAMHVNAHRYTIPLYEVDETTPLVRVEQRVPTPQAIERYCKQWPGRTTYFRHGRGFGPLVPIPPGVHPDPAGDAHVAFVDWGRGLAWDMWYAAVDEQGRWCSYTGMHYSIRGEGVFHTGDFPVVNGESIHFHGPGRAAGVPIIAGLILFEEVQAGAIRHKLAFGTRYNARQEFVFPATWTDGHVPGGLPEGCTLQLDPSLDLSRFDLSPAAVVIARAMQEYGCVNVDNCGGTTLYAEGLWDDPTRRSWTGLLDDDELKRIPIDRYRVLELGPVTPMGDGRFASGWIRPSAQAAKKKP